ncbi:MAG: ABC transporter ATP-binding protein [Polyangiales bacterium]
MNQQPSATPAGPTKRDRPASLIQRIDGTREEEQRPIDLAIVRRLIAFTKPYARTRNWLIAMVVIRAMQFPALGWTTAAILSGPIARRDAAGTGLGVIGLCALVISCSVVLHYRSLLALELGEAVIHDIRQTMLQHLLSQPLGFFHRQRVGSLISRLTSDLEAVRIGVKDVAFVSTVQAGSMVGASLLMLYYDWPLFLVLTALVPLLTAVIRHFRGRMIAAYRATQESFSGVTATVAESIGGIRVIQSHARGEVNSRAFRAQIHEHGDLNIEAARRSAVFLPLFDLNGQLFLALLLVIGGYRVLHGGMALEALLQFFFLSHYVFNPIGALGTQYNQALTAMAGAERVFALLDMQPSWTDPPNARALGPIRGHVELQGVTFGYSPRRPVLHDIDLRVEPGQSVALVGRTGSGKTTLLGLLAKFYLPDTGRVLIDQTDLHEVSTASLRSQLGCVLQHNFLFSGSVLDNIRLARPDASEADVRRAAEALDVLDLIDAFPHGLATQVGERGVGLSLGQRQLVCFTRALLADPRLLLLDEATSAVDAVAEQRLQTALARLLAGRTSFIVAHRLSTIRSADVVLVIDAGRIVERGDHASLLARDGAYRKLYREFIAGNATPARAQA